MKTKYAYSYRSYSGHLIEGETSLSDLRKIFRAIRSPRYTHSRTRQWCMQDVCSIYHRDSSSPSGKILAASGPDCVVNTVLSRCKKTSPLSPTEML